MKAKRLSAIALVATGVLGMASISFAQSMGDKRNESPKVATTRVKLAAGVMARAHVDLNIAPATLGAKAIDDFVQRIDPQGFFLLEPEVAALHSQAQKWADDMTAGSITLAAEVFELYRRRMTERSIYVLQQLREPNNGMLFVPSGTSLSERPQNQEDLRRKWDKWVSLVYGDLRAAQPTATRWRTDCAAAYKQLEKRAKGLSNAQLVDVVLQSWANAHDMLSSYYPPGSLEYDLKIKTLEAKGKTGIGVPLLIAAPYPLVDRREATAVSRSSVVREGDWVVSIANDAAELRDTLGIDADDLRDELVGDVQSEVTLRLWRPGSDVLHVVTTTRKAKRESRRFVTSQIVPTGEAKPNRKMAIVTVPSLYMDFANAESKAAHLHAHLDVGRILDELNKDPPVGVVLDLRGNQGGHLSQTWRIGSQFVGKSPIATMQTRQGNESLGEKEFSEEKRYAGPLVVLVDRHTASGGEILAAMLRDNERAILIGEQTFGAGTVQNLYPLDLYVTARNASFGGLTVTIARVYRSSGVAIESGLQPDILLGRDALLVAMKVRANVPPIKDPPPQKNAALIALLRRVQAEMNDTASATAWTACKSAVAAHAPASETVTGDDHNAQDGWLACAGEVLERMSAASLAY